MHLKKVRLNHLKHLTKIEVDCSRKYNFSITILNQLPLKCLKKADGLFKKDLVTE